jgi:hypothetical protein
MAFFGVCLSPPSPYIIAYSYIYVNKKDELSFMSFLETFSETKATADDLPNPGFCQFKG